SATVPVNGPCPGGGTMFGGTASLPAGDGSWAEVMVEWHPVIAIAASAEASTGSRSRRSRFIGITASLHPDWTESKPIDAGPQQSLGAYCIMFVHGSPCCRRMSALSFRSIG